MQHKQLAAHHFVSNGWSAGSISRVFATLSHVALHVSVIIVQTRKKLNMLDITRRYYEHSRDSD